jgi:NADH-quinone oxidoreductase subunit M
MMSFLLVIVLLLPLIAALALLSVPGSNKEAIRRLAFGAALVTFALSVGLATGFHSGQAGWQFEIVRPWIATPLIQFHVGIDGLSLWLVLLTTFLTPLAMLASWRSIEERVKEFFFLMLILETGMIGVFAALDLFLFYVFWEVSLVPMYFIIGVWGHGRRVYAALKFFLFTFAGSVLMLVAIIWLYNTTGSFDYPYILAGIQAGQFLTRSSQQALLFLAFFLAFAIKVPLFPLHTWLPDAHVEAPTAGSVILAGVLLKMGTYGLARFCLPMFPEAARAFASWIVVLAIIGIIYGALVAMVQPDLKKLVAYSSVSHLGFVVLGIFSFNQQALDGAIYQMVNHGVSTGTLFLLVGMLYDRRHTRLISEFGGLATPLPVLSAFFLFTTLSSIGLPALNNFVGEFLILLGAYSAAPAYTYAAAVGVILSAAYMLWMYQRVFFGQVRVPANQTLADANLRETFVLVPAMVMMVWMGVASPMFLGKVDATTAQILRQAASGHYHVRLAPPAASPAAPASGRHGGQPGTMQGARGSQAGPGSAGVSPARIGPAGRAAFGNGAANLPARLAWLGSGAGFPSGGRGPAAADASRVAIAGNAETGRRTTLRRFAALGSSAGRSAPE